MSAEDRFRTAAADLAQAFATALRGFDEASDSSAVRTRLPHPFSNMSRGDWAHSIGLWRAHGAPLLRSRPSRPCPTCGSARSDFIFDSYDAYPYHECNVCRTWFVPLEITDALFEEYFAAVPEARRFGDYTDSQAALPAVADSDRVRFDGYYQALKICLARAACTTLDIGCGVANSLDAAIDKGFVAEGIEVNRHAVMLARKLGRAVHFPGEPTSNEAFDVVTMWETLEHIADPLKALKDAYSRIKLDGLLALSVPNLNAPDIRSMRGDSMQIHGGPAWPGHMNLWTPSTLSRLLRRAGFEPVHIVGQYSTNLDELMAYHLGNWSGARDYLRQENPEWVLPSKAKYVAEAVSPAMVFWQQRFAFAPILFVLARRADGTDCDGLEAFKSQVFKSSQQSLNTAYALRDGPAPVRTRGRSIDLASPEWSADAAAIEGSRLRIDAQGTPAFGYLWRSAPFQLPPNSVVRIRGVVFEGGLGAGLQRMDRWVSQAAVLKPGPFEITLELESDASARLVICNNDSGSGGAVADVDCAEIVVAESRLS